MSRNLLVIPLMFVLALSMGACAKHGTGQSASAIPEQIEKEKDMTSIILEIWVDAPREKVWAAVADFGNVYKMTPDVLESKLTSKATRGMGITRHCKLAMLGATVEERVIAWVENEYLKIEVYEAERMPIVRDLLADYYLSPEDGGTRIRGTIYYGTKYGPFGAMMNSLLLKRMNLATWKRALAGHKHYIETGKTVTEKTKLDLSMFN